jgi:Tfp pilus assembly protein PilO
MKSVRQINLIGASVAAVLVVGAGIGPVRAMVAERNRLVDQRRSALVNLAEQGQIEERVAQAQQELESLQASIEELHRSFPPRLELDAFISELHGLAGATGTELVRVVPGGTLPGEVYSTVEVQVEARAPFDEFYHFLHGLQGMTRLSQVGTLRIAREGTGNSCTVQMTLYIFVSAKGELT